MHKSKNSEGSLRVLIISFGNPFNYLFQKVSKSFATSCRNPTREDFYSDLVSNTTPKYDDKVM